MQDSSSDSASAAQNERLLPADTTWVETSRDGSVIAVGPSFDLLASRTLTSIIDPQRREQVAERLSRATTRCMLSECGRLLVFGAEDDVAELVACGPDPDDHIALIEKFADAGFDHVYVHQVGPEQHAAIDFYEEEVLPSFA